ncbi:MobH family relaxase [Salinicola sp. JS01]|uniref:MobH family relaxase n=1 Tax=Salinicola sp. JS01 TaxID=3050071 RepID=UPI00255B7A96|nr:MobH family relaxase [Salinicola sp. JS01]WIX33282.1 MobH family relaxase [Salinicola sp. JS01]
MLRHLFIRPRPSAQGRESFQDPQTASELLSLPRRQQMVKILWDTTSLTHSVFNEYLLAPIRRYAELVQLLPASESHHHAYPGGMLDHALEMACYGLRLRQRHLLPSGAKPEDQSSAGELWSAAVIYGALMHDVAKTLVDVEIHLEDGNEWRLWHGAIPAPYRVRYRSGREYHLHTAVNPLLCERILGARVLDWMMTQPKLFSLFMYTITGHTERGGIVAELIHQADRVSVAKALGGDPVQALSAPVESIQRKLAEGLRYLVREQFKLNQKGGTAWLTDEALWLVSPKAVNELKTHLYALGVKSIPADLNRLYGELQAHGLIEEASEGKSVWKCEILDGEWRQSFNMIKVSPTLIWDVEGRPGSFRGKLTIKGEEAPAEDKPTNQEPALGEPEESASEPKMQPEELSTTSNEAEASAKVLSQVSPSSDTLDDDIMALFPEVQIAGTPEPANSSEPDSSVSAKNDDSRLKSSTQEVNNNSDLGKQFWQWLKMGVADHSIVINDTKAPIHTVEGTYFLVSPGIFKRFSTKVLGEEDQWKAVQKRFQKLGLHIRTQGQNIHNVSVEGPNKTRQLKGYLIKDPREVSQRIPPDNWVLTLLKPQEKKDGTNE